MVGRNRESEIIAAFIEQERQSAKGRRLEMLNRDLSGTIKLLTDILLPVFGTLDGFHLEYEIVSSTGVTLYADVYFEPLGFVFECDGFVPHVELITRDRFSFERMRMRSFALHGYKFIPFSRDEMDKKPDMCRRAVYELLGKYGHVQREVETLLPNERELIRFGAARTSFTQGDVRKCLMVNSDTARKIIRRLVTEAWIEPVGGSERRRYSYRVAQKGRAWLSGQ